ncbi:MAG: hypothetical protein SFU25_08195 [Candidatus Caenarcaniphilales bacterium]|nr:hypothetical protein [Candidatus Caenarcaniphilales bacterium]
MSRVIVFSLFFLNFMSASLSFAATTQSSNKGCASDLYNKQATAVCSQITTSTSASKDAAKQTIDKAADLAAASTKNQ